MPDGEYVPYIAGGSTSDDDAGAGSSNAGSEAESKLKEAREDAAKYRTQLRDLRTETEGFDANEFKKMKEEAAKAKEKEALARGDYDKLLEEKTKTLTEQIEAGKNEATKWKGMYETKIVDDSISNLAKANNAVDSNDIVTIAKAAYSISVDENGKVRVQKGGDIATDGEGNPLTVEQVVSGIIESRPHLVKSAGSGAGSTGGTGKGSKAELSTREKIAKGIAARRSS